MLTWANGFKFLWENIYYCSSHSG